MYGAKEHLPQKAFMRESVKPKLGFEILKAKIIKMNTLQKLINWAKAEEEKATKLAKNESKLGYTMSSILLDERSVAFSDMIKKAELLLKEETAKDLQKPNDCTCEGDFIRDDCPHHKW